MLGPSEPGRRPVELLGVRVDAVELADAVRDYRTMRLQRDRRRRAGEPAFHNAPMAELERRLRAGAQLCAESSPEPSVLSCAEFGQRVSLHASTVRRLAGAGRIEGARRIGREWAIPPNATIRPKERP